MKHFIALSSGQLLINSQRISFNIHIGILLMLIVSILNTNNTHAQAPVNDDICNAIQLTINGAPIIGDNTQATVQAGEPFYPNCVFQSDPLDFTVWYYFVADTIPSNYTVTTDLAVLQNNDTQIAAYSSNNGCSGPFSLVACNEDADAANFVYLSTMSITGFPPGDTVWIQVDGYGGTSGTFEIQVLSSPVPAFDAAIDSSSIIATGLAGYDLIPYSQNDPSSFFVRVDNLGHSSITNVAINGTVNPGANTFSANAATIPSLGSSVLNTSSIPLSNTGSSFTADFNVSMSEADGNTVNNNYSTAFTSGIISDSVFALENASSISQVYGIFGAPPVYANKFIFTSPDTITSITIGVGNSSGASFEILIDNFDQNTNNTTSNLWTSSPLPIPSSAGFYTYPVNLPVSAGVYLISIDINASSFMSFGTHNTSFRPNTSFYKFAGTQYKAMEIIAETTWIIRANMNTVMNQPATLSLFNLINPSPGSRIKTDVANPSSPVQISWNSSNTNNAGTIKYEWLLDAQGGNFTNPIFRIPSDNNGLDTTLTLTLGLIDSLLNSIGLPPGDSVDVVWTVRASLGSSMLEASNGPFDIRLVRDLLTGISPQRFDRNVKMYPNPNRGILIIEDSEQIVNSIQIYDFMGRKIKSFSQVKHRAQYDLSEISTGVYLVTFNTDIGNISRKLIIE
ncbi:MAG: T9SS type A sorting domain-containing protein [Cytophagales bacterium]